MAKIMTEPKNMPKTLRQQMSDFDYSKYENAKLISSRRKEIRAAANGERDEKVSANPKKAFRIANDRKDAGHVPVVHGSAGKVEHADRIKLAQFRNSKTDIKARARGEDMERPRAKSSQEKRTHARSPARMSPVQDVRRKLKFETDNDSNDVVQNDGIDFTDKLAALRALMNNERETKNIHDRKAYYNEYRPSSRKILVSRSDSLKENIRNGGEDLSNKDVERKVEDRKVKHGHRSVQSADIFREKIQDDRLSAADLQLLKNNLINRNKTGRHSADLLGQVADEGNQNHVSGNAMFHATEGRRILVSSRDHRPKSVDIQRNNNHVDSRPSSRNDAMETQSNSNSLNTSLRSVQSNVPFYEPVGTPMCRTPVIRESKKKLDNIRGTVPEGIEPGINISTSDYHSPGRAGKLQSNVEAFVGTSITPEKDKKKSEYIICNGDRVMDLGKSSASKRSKKEDKLFDEVKKLSVQVSQRSDTGNQRLSSRFSTSSKTEIFVNGEEVTQDDSDAHQRKPKERFRSKSSMDFDRDAGFNREFKQRIFERTNKTDRKVREWIEKQKIMGKDGLPERRDMLVAEFSVDICVSPRSTKNNSTPSPTHSCDKIPVKLEKPPRFRPESAPLFKTTGSSRIAARSSINTRLDQISNAALTEKNRLEQEFPVKDLPERSKNRQQQESDSTESESSIFSLPFSVRSGESVSSTIQATKLIRKLYNVDTETRENLVLMARCFRRWFHNVLHARARYQQILEEAGRVSPVTYGVMLRKSDICYSTTLLGRYFSQWRAAVETVRLEHSVQALQRRHLLKKGLNAFQWAINRSKLQQGILQDRINGMLLASNFDKWKNRTIENRRLRLQQAFLRWRQFTKEAQRIRMLRNQTNLRLKQTILVEWTHKFHTRLKENKANNHFRMVLVSQGWSAWRCFTEMSKEKKRRQEMAMQMFEGNLKKKVFVFMKAEYEKFRKAKQFHRTSQLRLTLTAWRAGKTICKAERADDLRVATVHWSHTTVRYHFRSWTDALLTRRAVRISDHNITKRAFSLWHQRYQHLIQRRQAVDSFTRHKILTKAFRHWCLFVALMKRRRAAAVERIHAALQRHVINRWRWYASHQRELRQRMECHVQQVQLAVQHRYLAAWRARFKDKCDLQTAQRFWSNTCTRKAADKWKLVCHRRKLKHLLVETEPLRQLATQRVFFMRWRWRLSLINEEQREASQVRSVLDLSQLRLYFERWKHSSNQLLLIKPMVLRYRGRLVTQCFTEWRHYVQHKAECSNSENQFKKVQLRNRFAAWRRQYQVHQIEKDINKKVVQAQARRCLQAWRFVITRKHAATKFREGHLVRRAFYTWNSRAFTQLRQRKLQKVEMESVMSTLREFFDRWRDKMLRQQGHAEESSTYIRQLREANTQRTMFNFWRRLFRATLVARENEKIRTRHLAKQALQEWHQYTQRSFHEAVERFAAAIGLHVGAGDSQHESADMDYDDSYQHREGDHDFNLEPMNLDLETSNPVPRSASSPRTPRTPITPRTPRQFSACGTPLKRLFSPPLSRQSLALSLDFETGAPLTTSFLDARFEMEHAVKTESRREIVVTAVSRLRHWPVGNVFEQWKEYTCRQRELKQQRTELITVREKLVLGQYMKAWVRHYNDMKLAKQHYDQVLQHKALLSLILYRNHRQKKKQMAVQADGYYARNVYCRVFPMWRTVALEKQHTEHIVHLWTNITEQERELIPRERSFRYQLNKKSLKLCYTTWFLSYQKITKLKRAYHRILLKKYFTAWSSWALEKHERKVKCEQFREKRVKALVFKVWCTRHNQKTEVERRYDDAWSNYQGVILQSWCRWAKDQRRHKLLVASVTETRHRHLVSQMFTTWKTSTHQLRQVQQWHDKRLINRTLYGWQAVAVWQKDLRQRALRCQIMSFTVLAKRVFGQWHACYLQRLELHDLQERRLQRRTLHVVQVWRKKAQVTRGTLLHQAFMKQQMQRMFDKWRAGYDRNMDREGQLNVFVSQKNQGLLSRCLDTWRTELMALQAQRVFNAKLMTTLLDNWKLAARGCRERSRVLSTHLAKKEQFQQKMYFLYWFNVAKARKSIRGHANLKIQLSVFKAWLLYTRKKNNLRRLEKAFTRKRNQRILENHWYEIKTRYQYCAELSETANRVIYDKNRTLMTKTMSHWVHRLQLVIADECHKHLLAKRVANRWRRFVVRRRQERQHMAELMSKATKFYNKKMCNKVYKGWFNEVLATRHNLRRRQKLGAKYALCWKHKVDMAYTAKCVRREHLLLLVWNKWHLEFVKHKAMLKVEAFQRKQTLTMIFVSWKNLSRKRPRVSMIPVPVSPAFNMPSTGSSTASTSTCSTPTEELMYPTGYVGRPSQIPQLGGARSRNTQAFNMPAYNTPAYNTPAYNVHSTDSSTCSTPTEELMYPGFSAKPSQIPQLNVPSRKTRLAPTGSGRSTPTGGSVSSRHSSSS